MKINLMAKNIELTEPIEVFVNDKIGGLAKFVKNLEPVDANVEIGRPSRHHRSGAVYYAEVNLIIKSKGGLLRAQAQHMDLRTAIVQVKDELQIQIKKFKERRKDLSRQPKKQ